MGKCVSKDINKSNDNILDDDISGKIRGVSQPEDERLRELDITSVPNVILENQMVRARVIDVYDGDTITVVFFIDNTPIQYKIRLNGIDTPEIRRGKGKLKAEKIAGKKCRDFLYSILHDQIVNILIHDWDKYGGRLLADVYTDFNTNISNLMMNHGYAIKYDGGKKHKWTRSELISIIYI